MNAEPAAVVPAATHAEAPPDQQAPIEVSLLDLSIALAQRNALAQLFGLVAIAGIGYFHQLWVVPLVLILLGVAVRRTLF